MAVLFPQLQFFNNNGAPLALGKVYTYITGTTTPKSTWTTAAEGANHPNPVVLDDEGRAEIWLSTDSEYRITIKSATDAVMQGPIDNVTGVGIQLSSFSELASDLDMNSYDLISTNNGDINFTPHGTGIVKVNGNTTQSGRIALSEDADNGTNTVTVVAPSSIASDKTITLQDVTGTVYVSSGTDIPVTDGGTGVSTLTTAYGTLCAGTTATGNVQTVSPGSSGAPLVSGGASALPSYTTLGVGGGGTGGTDAATARTNLGLVIGTNVAAAGANTDITSVYLNNTGLKIKDTNASHGLSIVPGTNITADRTLTLTLGDLDRTASTVVTRYTASAAAAATAPITGITTSSVGVHTRVKLYGTYTPSVDGATIELVTGTGGTPTYTTSGYEGIYIGSDGTTVSTGSLPAATGIELTMGAGADNALTHHFEFEVIDNGANAYFWTLTSRFNTSAGSGNPRIRTASGKLTDGPLSITAFKLTPSSGTISASLVVDKW